MCAHASLLHDERSSYTNRLDHVRPQWSEVARFYFSFHGVPPNDLHIACTLSQTMIRGMCSENYRIKFNAHDERMIYGQIKTHRVWDSTKFLSVQYCGHAKTAVFFITFSIALLLSATQSAVDDRLSCHTTCHRSGERVPFVSLETLYTRINYSLASFYLNKKNKRPRLINYVILMYGLRRIRVRVEEYTRKTI